MFDQHYAWLVWSLMLLAIWLAVYFFLRNQESRKEMLRVSLWTSLLGATEPLFVPEYWSPPSLFDLALRTGFDIESFLFSFGIGGLAVVIYENFFPTLHEAMSDEERRHSRHRYHFWALVSGPIIFVLLLIFTDWNHIYSASVALVGAGLFTRYCRPDLKNKMFVSAIIFIGLYFIYFLTLTILYPGYVEQVWNLSAISGILIFGVPIEELIFALSFGFYWPSVYEHLKWYRIKVT
ncbi:MAG: hypothetical protein HZB99_02330 [Candidatus Harrisonbacteria bacterium]|nr:hypothetical protein [Candidatus Harrisonbacteria bacterium]